MLETKFKHYPQRPKKLTAAFAKKEYARLLARLPKAEESAKPDLWLDLFADWEALGSYISSEAARTYHTYSQDMSNERIEVQERYIREKIFPVIYEPGYKLIKAFIKSRHRDALVKQYGKRLILIYEMALKSYEPSNIPLAVEAGNLSSKYSQTIARASVRIKGKKVNLSKARSLLFSNDATLREETYRASSQWFIKHHRQLADIFSQLTKLRNQKARNLKFKDYTTLAYYSMGRSDYGVSEVARFRKLVLKHIVPLNKEIAKRQAARLGKKSLRPWDVLYDPKYSLPLGTVPVNKQLDAAEVVFNKVSPGLATHFRYMRQHGLIDLETRPNKRAGAYCIDFSDEGKAAILCNSTGDPDDVRVLTHEMGHAFQKWESQPIKALELQDPTAELAEVHSMGMEFLSLPYIDDFFDQKNAKKFADYKWVDSIFLICYASIVDEFQHWIYANSGVATGTRDKKWIELYSKYLPAIDFSGLEDYASVRWYAQSHIFSHPFYYIDYALAETCAMQLAMIAQHDQKEAVEKYLKLCRIGGSKGFLEAIKDSGLRSPFDEAVITDVARHAEKVLI